VTTEARLRRCVLPLLLILFAVISSPHLFSADPDQQAKKQSAHGRENTKSYALLFGTVLDKNNHAVFGVKVLIHPAGRKKPRWEVVSDHSGEFAQRVPAAAADYVISAETKGKGPRPEVTVHVANDERVDFFLHLTE
jgi:hypothetical protein